MNTNIEERRNPGLEALGAVFGCAMFATAILGENIFGWSKKAKAAACLAGAVFGLGHALEYRLPGTDKPVDVPGLNAFLVPDYVMQTVWETRLRDAELIVSTPGSYSVKLLRGQKLVGETEFSTDGPNIVSIGGTSKVNFIPIFGPLAAGMGGFGWANRPGDFTVNIVHTGSDGQPRSFSAKL